MRLTGLLLVAVLAAGCRGDQRRQPTDAVPTGRGSETAGAQPTGTAGEGRTGLSEPSIASPETAKDTTAALAGFQHRVNEYAELHRELATGAAKQRETSEPARINKAEETLAARVQAARSGAKQGDIFTADVRPIFRRLLAPELKGAGGRDTRAILEDDAPPPSEIPFTVNATYPESQPLPTVPADILATLPTLPAPLEYRIIGRHLLLLDSASDVIVDYIPNAIRK
jgi:hypothetical protein